MKNKIIVMALSYLGSDLDEDDVCALTGKSVEHYNQNPDEYTMDFVKILQIIRELKNEYSEPVQ